MAIPNQINFSTGFLTLIPGGANPTPLQVGILQDVSLDWSGEKKLVFGNKQFALASFDGKSKIGFKAKSCDLKASLLTSVLPGSTSAAGERQEVLNEQGLVASGAFTVAGSATWVEDEGVLDETGKPMTRVAATPSAGQYSVSAGVYTFNAGANGKTYSISYIKTVAATGFTITHGNSLMGVSTTYALRLENNTNGQPFGIEMGTVVLSKIAFAFKQDDVTYYDVEGEALDDGSGNVWKITTAV